MEYDGEDEVCPSVVKCRRVGGEACNDKNLVSLCTRVCMSRSLSGVTASASASACRSGYWMQFRV
jgi:hypothetical protein